MGNCVCVTVVNRQVGLPPSDRKANAELQYPRSETVLIKVRDRGQKVIHRDKVLFEFPKAAAASCSEQEIAGQKGVISSKD